LVYIFHCKTIPAKPILPDGEPPKRFVYGESNHVRPNSWKEKSSIVDGLEDWD
jgi:hypothetical protein